MFNDGYLPEHNVQAQIYSYTAPCSIDPHDMVIGLISNTETLIKFKYSAIVKAIISIFVNVTEHENPQVNVTENLIISKNFSFEKHFLCKSGKDLEIKCHLPLGLKSMKEIKTNYDRELTLDRRYKIVIRLEPEEFKHRFVNMFYFDIESHENSHKLALIKQKIEIRKKCYYIYDIFGLESLKQSRLDDDSVNKFCKICLDNNIAVIILPCRHMPLCLDCAMLYNQKQGNQNKMKHECPICRGVIKSFINIQGLEAEK
jgi:hypothetical protein